MVFKLLCLDEKKFLNFFSSKHNLNLKLLPIFVATPVNLVKGQVYREDKLILKVKKRYIFEV